MGIQVISAPQAARGEIPGPLNLPPGFDRDKYAAKWEKDGHSIAAASQRQWLPGSNVTADGWEIWRDEDKKPHKVPLASGVFVLLCRPKAVQDAVNAICGNIGKSRLTQERKGETIAGVAPTDSGMLSDDKIAKVAGREETDEGDVAMNPVPDTSHPTRIETPALKTKSRIMGSKVARIQRRSVS